MERFLICLMRLFLNDEDKIKILRRGLKMGTDYYSYIVAGVDANEYISSIEYEENTPRYVEIDGKKEPIYSEDGKQIFNVKTKVGWIFNSQIYKTWDELGEALNSLGLTLRTQGCECEIWKGDAIGLPISECDGSQILDFDTMIDKLKKVGDILKSIGIDEAPRIINILNVDY